jgi:hypothetical protein
MPGDRVLIEILTTANMGGVTQAQGALAGLGLNTMAATAGLGLLALAGKSMIDISQEHAAAETNLAVAINDRNKAANAAPTADPVALKEIAKASDANAKAEDSLTIAHNAAIKAEMALTDARLKHGTGSEAAYRAELNYTDALIRDKQAQDAAADSASTLAAAQAKVGASSQVQSINSKELRGQIDAFMQTNRDFITNQNDVINSYTALVREGVPAKDLSRDMSIALNIQAADGGTLTDAVDKLQAAEIGRNKSLKTAVGLTLEAIPATATLAEKEAIVRANVDKVAAAYDGSTKAYTPLQIANAHLSTDWEKLAEKDGPGLVTAMAKLVTFIDTSLLPSFSRTSDGMGKMGDDLNALVNNPSWEALAKFLGWDSTAFNTYVPTPAGSHRSGSGSGLTAPAGQAPQGKPEIAVTVNAANDPNQVAAAVTQAIKRITQV